MTAIFNYEFYIKIAIDFYLQFYFTSIHSLFLCIFLVWLSVSTFNKEFHDDDGSLHTRTVSVHITVTDKSARASTRVSMTSQQSFSLALCDISYLQSSHRARDYNGTI